MDTLLQLINDPGPVRWVVDILLLPLIAVLLIFALRWFLLRFAFRGEKFERHQRVRQQTSKIAAILLSLVAVTSIWRNRFADLAGRTEGSLERREVLLDWMEGTVDAVFATVILFLSLIALRRTLRYAVARMDAWKEARKGVQLQGMVLITPLRVRQFAVLGMRVVRFSLTVALIYFYVPLVLSFIPATRPLAGQVMPLVVGPARDVGLSLLGYLPRLVSMVLILIGVRFFLKFLDFIMAAVAKGEISIPGFDPEWAEQTGRLLRIVVIMGTIMLIYPFLPGAGSDVFKGFSLFVGAMFTFGASSSVSNLISGIILTYTRSFRIDDRIEVGGTTGDVLARGLFVTRLRTLYNEEVTVPNNLALGGRVVNYSAASNTEGLVLRVTAGIGYDVDWRQVHELLKGAARATDHVLDAPEPTVLQTSLDDFAVEYQLMAWTDDPKLMVRTRSALRQNVLDQFADAGVEIMTPNVNALRNSVEPAIPEGYVGEPTPAALRFLGHEGSTP